MVGRSTHVLARRRRSAGRVEPSASESGPGLHHSVPRDSASEVGRVDGGRRERGLIGRESPSTPPSPSTCRATRRLVLGGVHRQ